LCIVLPGISKADAPQAFVSTHGSDMNPCTSDKPCQTFNQALTVVQAGGEIIVQDSGVYSNGFTISKSVTIDAAGFNASVIKAPEVPVEGLCTINTGPSDRVVLRGITFHAPDNSFLSGIGVIQAGFLYIERCSISGFNSAGVTLKGGHNYVTGTDIRRCNAGIAVFADDVPAFLVAHDTRIADCSLGFYLNSFGSVVSGLLSDCAAWHCGTGFFATGHQNVDMTLTNCRVFNNEKGVFAQALTKGSATIRIANCIVTGNSVGIIANRVPFSTGKAKVFGTQPGTNLVRGNVEDGTTSVGVALQ
jgi:hypothetical protein